jgi:hypothetical protein
MISRGFPQSLEVVLFHGMTIKAFFSNLLEAEATVGALLTITMTAGHARGGMC